MYIAMACFIAKDLATNIGHHYVSIKLVLSRFQTDHMPTYPLHCSLVMITTQHLMVKQH